jgi:CheY-like chemotaxis protein
MAKILLIDDDIQIIKLITSYLERGGHEITTATDGEEGINYLKSRHFDLLITDIYMPEQDGIGVLMWLRKQPERPKIIAISGGSASVDQSHLLEMARALSADVVLSKPVDFETLTRTVRELMQ